MRAVLIAALLAGQAAAEVRDEEYLVGDRMAKITVIDRMEILTVGPSEFEQMQVLSGADVGIVAAIGAGEDLARLGQPVLVAEVSGSQSCEAGDAREYWVVTLGEVPAPEGPVTTCAPLAPQVAAGAVLLEGPDEAWAWRPGKGWSAASD